MTATAASIPASLPTYLYPFLADASAHVVLPAAAPAEPRPAASPAFENGSLNWAARDLVLSVACRMAGVVSEAAVAAGLTCAAYLFDGGLVRYDAISPMGGEYVVRYFRTQMSEDADGHLVDGERVEIYGPQVPYRIRAGLDEAILTQRTVVHVVGPQVFRAVLDTFRPAVEEILRALDAPAEAPAAAPAETVAAD